MSFRTAAVLERGGKRKSDKHDQYLADNGIALVSANYRMYPDARERYAPMLFVVSTSSAASWWITSSA